jgi:hypothetical protein
MQSEKLESTIVRAKASVTQKENAMCVCIDSFYALCDILKQQAVEYLKNCCTN